MVRPDRVRPDIVQDQPVSLRHPPLSPVVVADRYQSVILPFPIRITAVLELIRPALPHRRTGRVTRRLRTFIITEDKF